ncbi:MAG TPA: hypothetical protein VNW52_04085 [Burkholderiaceae bacterium]|jgi:hypothetical protein|nr:hypothetical protein [Burkholderiaceae bacterium]
MSKSKLDAGIPVLTEVIDASLVSTEPVSKPVRLHTAPVREVHEMHAVHELADVVDVPTIDGWLNEEWNRLERKIGGRILHQVMDRLESDIENRVRDALADVLQIAVEGLANDIKQNLQVALKDLIAKAVKEEISHMQISKK